MNPDTLAALAAYVSDHGVSSARIVGLHAAWHAVECSAGDGSRWHVMTDKYATAYGWRPTLSDAAADLANAIRLKAGRYELEARAADADGLPAEAERALYWWHELTERAARMDQAAQEIRRWEAA